MPKTPLDPTCFYTTWHRSSSHFVVLGIYASTGFPRLKRINLAQINLNLVTKHDDTKYEFDNRILDYYNNYNNFFITIWGIMVIKSFYLKASTDNKHETCTWKKAMLLMLMFMFTFLHSLGLEYSGKMLIFTVHKIKSLCTKCTVKFLLSFFDKWTFYYISFNKCVCSIQF